MTEEDVLGFAAASFKSVWALELLLLLKRDSGKAWRTDELIRELRSSDGVVASGLANLISAGVAVEEDGGAFRYQAGSPQIDELVNELARVYAVKPVAVIRAIVTAPSEKLRILSDAFKLKK